MRRSARFARNVGVNVLANLIAAGIIYAAGVATGLFPRSTEAVATAMAVVGLVALWSVGIAAEAGPNQDRRELFSASTVVVLGVLLLIYTVARGGAEKPFWWLFMASGLFFVVFGVLGVVLIRRGMSAAKAGQRRIKGLSWYSPR